MRKNIVPLGVIAVSIFGLGVSTGIIMAKSAMKKRGVIL